MGRRYCKVFNVTAPPVLVYQSPPEEEILVEGETEEDFLAQQEEYALQIFTNGISNTPVDDTFSISADATRPTWDSFGIEITDILNTYGTGRIVDFSFQRQASAWAENAYVRNVKLTMLTDEGTIEVPFNFSNAREVDECDIQMHPVSSSGQIVHTYEFVPEVETLFSASLTFELADDWYCPECCGDLSDGVAIDVVIGVENLP